MESALLTDAAGQAGVCSAHGIQTVRLLDKPKPRMLRQVDRNWSAVDPGLQDVFVALCLGEKRWPLLLWGVEGTGKSMAGLCFCDLAVSAAHLDQEQLCTALVTPGDSWWDVAKERPLIVLDEVGSRDTITSVDFDALKRFADYRERYANRVAVYITNHPPDRLGELYDRRIYSRLTCGTVFELTGPDRRKVHDRVFAGPTPITEEVDECRTR